MPVPTDRYSIFKAQQRFYEAQTRERMRQQSMFGGLSAAAGLAAMGQQQRQQDTVQVRRPTDYVAEPKGIREVLQAETDEWLKDYD